MTFDALTFPDEGTRIIAKRMGSVTTAAALTALPLALRGTGDEHLLESNGHHFRHDAASAATDTTGLLAKACDSGTGAWLRSDRRVHVYAAIGFGTANNAVLFTVPTGFVLKLTEAWWEVTTGFTGGSSSAVGLSSSNTSYNTAGDLLGGATGDIDSTLVAGKAIGGTIGTKFGSNGKIVLIAADTVKFNRITSVFAAGAGYAHLMFDVLDR